MGTIIHIFKYVRFITIKDNKGKQYKRSPSNLKIINIPVMLVTTLFTSTYEIAPSISTIPISRGGMS